MRNPIFAAWRDIRTVDLPEEIAENAVDTEAIRILRILDDVAVLKENLRHKKRPSCHLIAVGDNRLSRGLTLCAGMPAAELPERL